MDENLNVSPHGSNTMLAAADKIDLVSKAKEYAIKCHSETNHLYDGKPYETHLHWVYVYGIKYGNLLTERDLPFALAACWTHDTIEDCRQTYNDVKNICGIRVAEITYAVTNEKGKNRKERANDKYYEGIRLTPLATFVKICDRLANIRYSVDTNSKMLSAYRNEFNDFRNKLWSQRYQPMFADMERLLTGSS